VSDFLIRVRTLPGELAPIVKLRRLLKRLGRSYQLKCIDVREVEPDERPAVTTAQPQTTARSQERER
jgi:hypothetical protein